MFFFYLPRDYFMHAPSQWETTSHCKVVSYRLGGYIMIYNATPEYGLYQWELRQLLEWRHNERDGVSNHQLLDCLLNRLFRRRSKKTSKLRVTGFVRRIHRWPVNSPHKGPVTRKCVYLKTSSWYNVNLHWPGPCSAIDRKRAWMRFIGVFFLFQLQLN